MPDATHALSTATPSAPDVAGRPVARWGEWLPLTLAILGLIAAVLVIHLRKSIWLDEAITMDQTGGSLGRMFDLTRTESLKPPLYYLLVWAWRRIVPGIEGVRAFSTVCVIVTALALDRAGKLLGAGSGVWGLGVLAALTAHLAWAGTEARAYGLALALVACATWLFARLFVAGSLHVKRDATLFVAACYAALLTFYYTGFVLAGLFLAGLVFSGRRRLLIGCGLALALLMLPWTLIVSGQVGRHSTYLPDVVLDSGGGAAMASNIVGWVAMQLSHTVHRTVPFYNGALRQATYLALVSGIVAVRLWQARGRLSRVETWAVLFAATVFSGFLVLRLLNRTTVDVRHLAVAAIPVLVCAGVLGSRLQPVLLARGTQAALLATSVAGLVSLARHEKGSADWHSAIRWVMAEEKPGQPIMSFNSNANAIAYYYQGPNAPVVRIPEDQTTRTQGGRGMELTPAEIGRLRAFLARSAGPDLVFWVIERAFQVKGPDIVQRYLQPVTVLEQRDYYNVRAYKVRLSRPVEP